MPNQNLKVNFHAEISKKTDNLTQRLTNAKNKKKIDRKFTLLDKQLPHYFKNIFNSH